MLTGNHLSHRLKSKGFTLVLSGGAALGCAHLGVLEYLEAHDLFPREIVGTSMGAIVGAAHARGFSTGRLKEFFREFARLTQWVEFSWSTASVLNTKKISGIFDDLFGGCTFGQLKTPLKIIATDFESGEVRVFSKEDSTSLRDAVLCSMSIPVLFPPVKLEDRLYVDGGLCANLPVAYVTDPAFPIVAVDVMSRKLLEPIPESRSFFAKARTLMEWSERTFYLIMQHQTDETLKKAGDVVCLKPDLAGYKVYHFDKWDELRVQGFKEGERVFE